jgi:hypothetical protein
MSLGSKKKSFESVDAPLMCVAIGEFDCVLYEDENTNRLEESLNLWDQICNSRWFRDSLPVLIFTQDDIFRQKLDALRYYNNDGTINNTRVVSELRRVPILTEYDGDGTYGNVLSYITNLFMSRVEPTNRQIMIAICNACNVDSVEYVFRHILAALRARCPPLASIQ